jgi:hypothetical protein
VNRRATRQPLFPRQRAREPGGLGGTSSPHVPVLGSGRRRPGTSAPFPVENYVTYHVDHYVTCHVCWLRSTGKRPAGAGTRDDRRGEPRHERSAMRSGEAGTDGRWVTRVAGPGRRGHQLSVSGFRRAGPRGGPSAASTVARRDRWSRKQHTTNTVTSPFAAISRPPSGRNGHAQRSCDDRVRTA